MPQSWEKKVPCFQQQAERLTLGQGLEDLPPKDNSTVRLLSPLMSFVLLWASFLIVEWKVPSSY